MPSPDAAETIDLVRPCSYCGASCMGELHFRSIPDDGMAASITFMTDRPTIEEPLRDLVGRAIDARSYPGLPEFVRAWNEGRGWVTFTDGGAVSAFDLLTTARAVLAADEPHHTDAEVWLGLQTFVQRLLDRGAQQVWIVDD